MRSIPEPAQSREQWRMGNVDNFCSGVRSDASERQRAIGAAGYGWRQKRAQLEHVIGSGEAQIGGQQPIIDDQWNIMLGAEGYIADLNARVGGKLNAASSFRMDAETRLRDVATRDDRMRAELADARQSTRQSGEAERATSRDLPRNLQAAKARVRRLEKTGKTNPECQSK